jgi:Putative prokaryotic signal transducing protein
VSAEGLVRVWSTGSVPEGEIAKARLEAEGIPVLLKGEGEGPYRMGPVHVWVPAELEVQARLILDAAEAPIGEEELRALAESSGGDQPDGQRPGDEP